MEYLNSPRLMCQFASGELHFLVYMGYKSLGIDVGDRSHHPIIEILLHLGNIAYPLLDKPLELGNINIAPVHGQRGILWEIFS